MTVIEIIEKLKKVKDKDKEIYICTPPHDNDVDKFHYERISCIGISLDGVELFSSELFCEDEEIL